MQIIFLMLFVNFCPNVFLLLLLDDDDNNNYNDDDDDVNDYDDGIVYNDIMFFAQFFFNFFVKILFVLFVTNMSLNMANIGYITLLTNIHLFIHP